MLILLKRLRAMNCVIKSNSERYRFFKQPKSSNQEYKICCEKKLFQLKKDELEVKSRYL